MSSRFDSLDTFPRRHIGPSEADLAQMLKVLEVKTLDELIGQTVPKAIRTGRALQLPAPKGEAELLEELETMARENQVFRSFIGAGYHDTITPGVILRNILMNPGWYTQYTPYQAEISQGRLEALLVYQTMVAEMTGLPVANASLLDEGTAAAEAMAMFHGLHATGAGTFFVSDACHPQTVDVLRTRAWPHGWELVVGDHRTFDWKANAGRVCGALLQYPATDGAVHDYRAFIEAAHAAGAKVAMACDLLGLALLTPPGELGADVALGNTQRFGVPMGYGGPHAAYFACRQDYVRAMPGRLIGVSEDANGNSALRMTLQTREQHIRREKATSNICTAQVLLAIMAGMYAVYHGPQGILAIATRVRALTQVLARGLARLGFKPSHETFFDTLRVETSPEKVREVLAAAETRRLNLRRLDDRTLGMSLDETTSRGDLERLLSCFAGGRPLDFDLDGLAAPDLPPLPAYCARVGSFLSHPVFGRYHSETEMLRYIRGLEAKDLSLCHSMIPLGSCTMKLNAVTEMIPVTWPQFGRMHPFAPVKQAQGYQALFSQLEAMLAEITGMAATSLQPNAGSQGEFAGLLVIRKFHETRGQADRDVLLIPQSAHGTNPASAVLAGYQVVVVKTDAAGNVDLADLRARAAQHQARLAGLMVTYPSTHGVFEEEIREICDVVHQAGGQVYMDGANLNAQVGLSRPGEFGADVLHINLHKTFAIPHGGGGPGMGPICVREHLAPFLPGHPVVATGGEQGVHAVSAAPWGSASILPISWLYIRLMGAQGLTRATQVAILNANYLAKRLGPHFPVVYCGKQGRVAHECIIDLRELKKTSGVEVGDVAKRLMDYGFHAPTVSFPVAGTLMIEPTESESKFELDRFVDAMVAIRQEIREIEDGKAPRDNNLLKHAPHTAQVITADEWTRPYGRARAAFPSAHTQAHKFWPTVGRVNDTLGDRKLAFTCPPVDSNRS